MLLLSHPKETKMPELTDLHNTAYNDTVSDAHAFVTNGLGLTTSGRDQVTVVSPHDAGRAKQKTNKGASVAGGYRKSTGDVVVYASHEVGHEKTDAKTGSLIVHELTHGGSLNDSYHPYYNELLAGLGENKYLEWLKTQGRLQPASSFTLRKAGVTLHIPGSYRYYDADTPNTSQGLVAASSGKLALVNRGISPEALLATSSLGGHEQFGIMRQALDSLHPGLASTVERLPENTDGILQASAAVSEAAAHKGITHL